MPKKPIYKIIFQNQGNLYELYAREVSQDHLYAFITVDGIIFGERSKLVVDPSDERLKAEFAGVRKTFIPLHAVIRIDEVDKEGENKITMLGGGKNGNTVPSYPLPFEKPKD